MTSTSGRSSTSPEGVVEQVFRSDWGRLLARLVARTRRLDLAEDALGEAFARAADRWPSDGVPENPAAWLYTTAHRQVLGRLRAEATAGRKAPLLAVGPRWVTPDDDPEEWADDRLPLILLCCHPALPAGSRSALALRLVIGTPTEEIARLFLVSTSTMAARLTRAKKKIVLAGIPLGTPLAPELDARLDEVCRTIYLAFTAGYTPGAGPDLLRADLADDAVRLAGVLADLVPDAPQVRATHALLLLQHARRDARQHEGRLVRLAGHYVDLDLRTGSAIVRLNRAVAVAEAEGPQNGLELLVGLDEALPDHHRVAAVRAELARRAGDLDAARAAYRTAIERCANEVERAHLVARLAALP